MALCTLTILAALVFGAPAAPQADVTVRIGLVRRWSNAASITVTAPAGARLVDAAGREAASGPAAWRLQPRGAQVSAAAGGVDLGASALWRVIPAAGGDPLRAAGAAERAPRGYRGILEVGTARGRPNALRVVNEVPLEAYLRGVAPVEMDPRAPREALRAQAVVARSYALATRGRYAAEGYDLVDTTMSQVYDGADCEKPATDSAVRDTAGLVLTRRGALLAGDYYADCGGATSGGERDGDYPPSVVDAPPGGQDYCAGGRYHTWTLILTGAELARAAGKPNAEATGVEVVERDASGRARSVRVTCGAAAVTVRAYRLRAAIGYDRLRSTWFEVAPAPQGGFELTGRGWGHGHGMCQQGAMGMAGAPHNRSFRDILAHYFPGSAVAARRAE